MTAQDYEATLKELERFLDRWASFDAELQEHYRGAFQQILSERQLLPAVEWADNFLLHCLGDRVQKAMGFSRAYLENTVA